MSSSAVESEINVFTEDHEDKLVGQLLWIVKIIRPLGYERVHQPLFKVEDTPCQIQGDESPNEFLWNNKRHYLLVFHVSSHHI